jgi:hypothetical protein
MAPQNGGAIGPAIGREPNRPAISKLNRGVHGLVPITEGRAPPVARLGARHPGRQPLAREQDICGICKSTTSICLRCGQCRRASVSCRPGPAHGNNPSHAARDQYAALLPISERILGPDHADTLTTRADLAHWKGKADHG